AVGGAALLESDTSAKRIAAMVCTMRRIARRMASCQPAVNRILAGRDIGEAQPRPAASRLVITNSRPTTVTRDLIVTQTRALKLPGFTLRCSSVFAALPLLNELLRIIGRFTHKDEDSTMSNKIVVVLGWADELRRIVGKA